MSEANFLGFLSEECGSMPVHKCDILTASKFKMHMEQRDYAPSTKNCIWFSVSAFFKTMNGFDGMKFNNPYDKNPYESYKKLDYKYIPEHIAKKLDEIFKEEGIELHLRCIYWILRLIPSRITEVLSMKIDCVKPYNGNYVIFIPTWKQNGGYKEPLLRSIHVQDTGIAGYLLDLIRE